MSVRIDPTIRLKETEALLDWFRQRSLIQAQAIADLRAELSAAQARCQDLEAAANPDTCRTSPRPSSRSTARRIWCSLRPVARDTSACVAHIQRCPVKPVPIGAVRRNCAARKR